MRKFFAVVILGAILSLASLEQVHAQAFNKGSLIGEAGLAWPGVYGSLEYGLTDKIGPGRIGVGATLGLPLFSGFFGVYLGPEAYYHFEIPAVPQLDLAAGLGVYFGLVGGFYVGPSLNFLGRYYFTDRIGVALHANYGFVGGVGGGIGVAFKL